MNTPLKPLTVVAAVIISQASFAQRGHEIQIQAGVLFNSGTQYFDYYETDTKRHNFEIDHIYDAEFLSISWHYPINAYLDIGLQYARSIDASSELLQAESALFDDELGEAPQLPKLYAGLTDLESRYTAYSMDLRVNHLIRSNKYKFYFILSPGVLVLENYAQDDAYETQDNGLRQALESTYTGKSRIHSLGIGMGVSYPLKSGIHLKLLEIYDRSILNRRSTNAISFGHSLEVRTGISYQFYRKK